MPRTLGEPGDKGVKELAAAPGAGPPARRARRLGHFALVGPSAEAPGEHRRRECLQVGLPGHRGVEGVQPPGRLEQQRRRVAPALAREHDLRAQPLPPRALELVTRPDLGRGQQLGRGRHVSDVELRLGRGERALDAHGRVWRQLGGPLQERRGRRQPAAALRPAGRALQLAGYVLVRPVGRASAVPTPGESGVQARVGRLGEGPVGPHAARVRGAGPVSGERDERMTEPHARADLDQSGCLGRSRSAPALRYRAARAARHRSGTSPTGSAASQQSRRRVSAGSGSSWRTKPCSMRLLSGTLHGQPESAREPAIWFPPCARARAGRAGCRPPTRGSGLAPACRTGRGTVASSSRRASSASRPSTTTSVSPSSPCSWPESRSANTSPTCSARSRRATERERLHGHPVQPLRVVDDAEERLLLGGVGQQAQDGQADQEAIPAAAPALMPNAVFSASRCGTGRFPRRPSIGAHSACRPANASSISDSTPAAPDDPASPRAASDRYPSRGGLADSRLAAQDQRTALTRAHSMTSPSKHAALAATVEQPRP